MKYFTMAEMCRSEEARKRGYKNEPSAEERRNIVELVEQLLDPLRDAWAEFCGGTLGSPAIKVTSGYRSAALNEIVGGVPSSAHRYGFAADIVPANGRLLTFKAFAYAWLLREGIAFDQFISENEEADGTPEWLHIAIRSIGGEQRRQCLSLYKGKYQRIRI